MGMVWPDALPALTTTRLSFIFNLGPRKPPCPLGSVARPTGRRSGATTTSGSACCDHSSVRATSVHCRRQAPRLATEKPRTSSPAVPPLILSRDSAPGFLLNDVDLVELLVRFGQVDDPFNET